MFSENLVRLRKLRQWTQEDVADKVGVTRQAIAKWEAGDSVPDIRTARKLAEVFGVSLDDLVETEGEGEMGLGVPPRGKHLFGVVTVGEKGQMIIPAKARKVFSIAPGDQLIVLGDEGSGLAMIKAGDFLNLADMVRSSYPRSAGASRAPKDADPPFGAPEQE